MADIGGVEKEVLEALESQLGSLRTTTIIGGEVRINQSRVDFGDKVKFNRPVTIEKHYCAPPQSGGEEDESLRQLLNECEDRSLWSQEFLKRLKTRSEWFARAPKEPLEELITRPAPYVVVGHTVCQNYTSFQDCLKQVQNVQMFHFSQSYSDIGYNFLVGGDGNVYVGRGWRHRGAHTKFFNSESIGVAFIGNFEKELPPKEQLEAFRLLLEEGVRSGQLAPDYKLFLQSQLRNSDSPGEVLSRELKTWSHWRPYDETLYPRTG